MNTTKTKLAEAVETLSDALKTDKDYYFGWQSNIAMSFVDAYDECMLITDLKDIHRIANEAAKSFLDKLINQK